MRRQVIVVLLALVGPAIVFAQAPVNKAAAAKADTVRHGLVGTWRYVSGNYGGQEAKFSEGVTTLKHVTPTQFTVVTYEKDGKVTRVIGGSYAVRGEVYEETPAYGLGGDFDVVKGRPQTFKWRVEQNTWHSAGTLSNGLAIEEAWERVEQK